MMDRAKCVGNTSSPAEQGRAAMKRTEGGVEVVHASCLKR